ncbi:hypothetical protein WJ54_07180 [Burkholderia ubonensis]|nr:hypothetical protein WJ34_08575 [Burkholderia ubonensis]KVM33328.1 hypothetical protein WJ54_07180 [Burkholderia ubonensis]KVN54166.1 hypothetical protein WJ65_27615 [Burkholderia ubonensis]KVR29188.1 hypothetical protein WK13_03005 [Burkholderia ubonensis]KVZ44481.1 hypothetical protein WL17_05380 [Burkholderia ubonensis]
MVRKGRTTGVRARSGRLEGRQDDRPRTLLYLDDHPRLRRVFEGFHIEVMPLQYTVAGGHKGVGRNELSASAGMIRRSPWVCSNGRCRISMWFADFIFDLLFFEKSFQIINSLFGDRDEAVFRNQAGAGALRLRGLGCNIAIALLFSVIKPRLL